MAQDYVYNVYDSTFEVQTTMANVEKNFAALKSSFSGAGAPSDPIAGMWWFDTTANILKLRNEANNAWLSIWDFANNKPLVTNNVSADFGAALKDPVAATAGLRTLGTGAAQAAAGNQAPPDASVTPAKLTDGSVTPVKLGIGYVASDVLLLALGSGYHHGTTPTKVKEAYIPRSGSLRVKFKLTISTVYYLAYCRVYRDGTPVGTLVQWNSSAQSGLLSQDIDGWTAGNKLQVYLWANNVSMIATLDEFAIYGNDAFSVYQIL